MNSRAGLLFPLLAFAATAAGPTWLDRVSPILSPAEKKTYLALPPDRRSAFEEGFWSDKSIAASDYFARLNYIDATFGSGKTASGANTDPGRVYLSLGPPNRITHIPSSRVLVPLDIWYYDAVPGVLQTELRLIFYQPNSVGLPRLYSPVADTIRALLLPQASTKGMFGPNDNITESDIRKVLKTGPAEDEAITAGVGVASGIKYSGNDEILGRIASPRVMLGRPLTPKVTSRIIASHPILDTVQTASPYGGLQIDLSLKINAQREVNIEIQQQAATVYQNQLHLKFPKPETIAYTHRLDLLPGSYRVVFTVDGQSFGYPLEVIPQLGEILRVDVGADVEHRQTPFEFNGRQWALNPNGNFAALSLPRASKVTWMIRKGTEVVWRTTSDPTQLAMVELPSTKLPPGTYRLEAVTETESRNAEFIAGTDASLQTKATLVSFNANLAPASRMTFVGHQYLLRGNTAAARQALGKASSEDAQVELARADAMEGNLDAARDRVRRVLAATPNHFEALAVFAYIETRLQDYTVAAEYYRRALGVQDSPALRAALEKLPAH